MDGWKASEVLKGMRCLNIDLAWIAVIWDFAEKLFNVGGFPQGLSQGPPLAEGYSVYLKCSGPLYQSINLFRWFWQVRKVEEKSSVYVITWDCVFCNYLTQLFFFVWFYVGPLLQEYSNLVEAFLIKELKIFINQGIFHISVIIMVYVQSYRIEGLLSWKFMVCLLKQSDCVFLMKLSRVSLLRAIVSSLDLCCPI